MWPTRQAENRKEAKRAGPFGAGYNIYRTHRLWRPASARAMWRAHAAAGDIMWRLKGGFLLSAAEAFGIAQSGLTCARERRRIRNI